MADLPSGALGVAARKAKDRAEQEAEAYSAGTDEDRPLEGYLGLLGVYATFAGALGAVVRLRRSPLPERVEGRDLALVTVATHKLARLVTKDPVTSPLRAAFTRFAGPSGDGEIHEEVRGKGFRHAVGELLTCPFCIGQWIATAFVFGLVTAPRLTRLVATTFAVLAGSDALQLAYAKAEELVG